jgi:hypothetical protein
MTEGLYRLLLYLFFFLYFSLTQVLSLPNFQLLGLVVGGVYLLGKLEVSRGSTQRP